MPYSSLEPIWMKAFTFRLEAMLVKFWRDIRWLLNISLPPFEKFLWSIYPEQLIIYSTPFNDSKLLCVIGLLRSVIIC